MYDRLEVQYYLISLIIIMTNTFLLIVNITKIIQLLDYHHLRLLLF